MLHRLKLVTPLEPPASITLLKFDNNTTLGTLVSNTHTINGVANFDLADIQIRGSDAVPIFVGRGGGAVAVTLALVMQLLAQTSLDPRTLVWVMKF